VLQGQRSAVSGASGLTGSAGLQAVIRVQARYERLGRTHATHPKPITYFVNRQY